MDKIVEEQLKNCIYANLNNFDSATNTYHIPKYSKPQYKVGKCYIVRLSAGIVNNKNSVMATNWNGGSAPTDQCMVIYINSIMGTNVKVDGRGYDYNTKQSLATMWSGWLNTNEMDQLAELA